MDSFHVLSLLEAAPQGDIFITVTGCSKVLRSEHFMLMKNRALLANAGHFDIEIDKQSLAELTGPPQQVRQNVEAYTFPDGRCLYLLGEGRLVNLAAADGHPVEIMDMSFGLQVLALRSFKKKGPPGKQGPALTAGAGSGSCLVKIKSAADQY